MMAPELEYVFELRVSVSPELHVRRGADEQLGFTPITGGTVNGPRLNGRVLPGGGDWAVLRSATAQLEARYLLQAEDGAVIDVVNRGYFRATDEILARIADGQEIPEDEPGLYFRTAPVFRTDAPRHRWLAEHQFLGVARDDDGQICIRVFLLH